MLRHAFGLLLLVACAAKPAPAPEHAAAPVGGQPAEAANPAPGDQTAACEGGDAEACLALAREEYNAGDTRQALVSTSKACRAGDRASCVYAAKAVEDGDGIEVDLEEAAMLYKAGCKLGDDAACDHFARLRSPTPGAESRTEGEPTSIARPTFPKIGVRECDEYMEMYAKCVEDKLPPDVAKTAYDALLTSVDAWRKAAETPAGRRGLAEACATARDAVAESCGW